MNQYLLPHHSERQTQWWSHENQQVPLNNDNFGTSDHSMIDNNLIPRKSKSQTSIIFYDIDKPRYEQCVSRNWDYSILSHLYLSVGLVWFCWVTVLNILSWRKTRLTVTQVMIACIVTPRTCLSPSTDTRNPLYFKEMIDVDIWWRLHCRYNFSLPFIKFDLSYAVFVRQ